MTKHDSKDEEILAGAPNNTWMAYSQDNDIYVTPLDNGNYLFKTSGATKSWVGNKLGFTRSQSDIVELVELRKKNAELENTVSVLMIADETGYVDDGGFVIGFSELTDEARNILAIRDLEQKADELKDLLDMTDAWSMMNTYAITVDDIHERMTDLRKQAKQLKGEE